MKKALNIACGRNTIQSTEEVEWVNIDSYERENELDYVIDVTKEFPFKKESCEYIYVEQFLEHLSHIEGKKFLLNCYRVLKKGGILRLVLPHFKKIFEKYIKGDREFFEPYFKSLNGSDYDYYYKVYTNPEKVLKKRKNNPPPEWHTSNRAKDRRRVEERVKYYDYIIEIVNYMVYQYGEHKALYDFVSLSGILKRMGFSEVYETEIKEIDSHAPTRIIFSIYIEAIK